MDLVTLYARFTVVLDVNEHDLHL